MNSLFSLSTAPIGIKLSIRQLSSQPEVCARLRELGFREKAIVRCISRNGIRLICEVCNSRVGLGATVAQSILVAQY